jgi:hypothetical protein
MSWLAEDSPKVSVPSESRQPVTIGAADFTFGDFLLNRRPRPAATEHVSDVALLLPEMVELKDDDVRFPTIDTGMSQKVFDHPALVVASSGGRVPQEPRLLSLSILPVVLAPVRSKAIPTPGLELWLAAPHRRKRVERLHLAAFRARSHEGERAVASLSCE